MKPSTGSCANCQKNLNNEGAGMCAFCKEEFCDDCLQEDLKGKIHCSACEVDELR